VRPDELSSDKAGTYEVLVHALEYYLKNGKNIETIVLLQPTSPFRKIAHVREAMSLWDNQTDLIVGVKKTKANPYYVLMEENTSGYLEICKSAAQYNRRQDIPDVYEINGALYIIDAKKLLEQKSLRDFKRTKKYVMSEIHSVDIDEPLDWIYAESILKSGLLDL
jgi:CMP-N,N'-diacetyllegionaminic acid synthase